MAFSSADWTINYTAKTVTNNDSGTGNNLPATLGNYTKVGPIIEFFQWLATTFANSVQMDDDYAIQSDTPTVYKWLNGWTFGNANDFKYLYGGSIEDPVGSGTATADSLWSGLYTIGSQTNGTQVYLIQNDVEVTPWWLPSDGTAAGNIDIIVHVKDTGAWLQSVDTTDTLQDGGVWLYAREMGDLFDHNYGDLSGGGRNPIGINTAADSGNKSGDLYLSVASATGFVVGDFVKGGSSGAVGKIAKIVSNDIYLNAVRGGTFVISETLIGYSDRPAQTASTGSTTNDGATAFTNVVAGRTGITISAFGTISRDLDNGAGATNYDVEIDANADTMANMYEWLKYETRYGSATSINGDVGQEYRSASEGTYAEVKVAPFGTLAGSTFYGARGVWVTNGTDSDFVLINANNVEQSPPDYQKVIVTHPDLDGSVSTDGSVTVYVAEITAPGGTIIKNQYTIDSATASTIDVTVAIDINKVPASGVLRCGSGNLQDTRYDYTGFDGVQFTGVSPSPSAETGSLYVPLLDLEPGDIAATTKQSDNIIYSGTPFDVRTVVRRYGTKPYTADTTFGATGTQFSPIITDDPQAV